MRKLIMAASLLALAACQNKGDTPADAPAAISAPKQAQEISRTPTKNAYFGDLHVHTKNSFDAYVFWHPRHTG